ncbi:MAG: hypothetical protein ABH837_01890 [bacterium]
MKNNDFWNKKAFGLTGYWWMFILGFVIIFIMSFGGKKDTVDTKNTNSVPPAQPEEAELKADVSIIKEGTNDVAVSAGSSRTKTQEIIITADFTKEEMEKYIRKYFDDNNIQVLWIFTDRQAYDIGERIVDDYDSVTKEEIAIFDEKYIAHMMYNWKSNKTTFNWMATAGKYAVK